MPLFTKINEEEFIRQYWQQRPLLLPQSFAHLKDMISGDELAGMACEEEVESRIISGFELAGNWQCRQGPFDEHEFAAMPARNWTLLVQGVDRWDANIRSVLDEFGFLPTWRLEDIMASYAPVGGGVGPHFDYYDVFLIQVAGARQWRLGRVCDENTPLRDNDEVRLLAGFDSQAEHTVAAGDALYIPAGVAHWGRAQTDDCITLSVGFRAPSSKEIVAEALEIMLEQFPDNERYEDSVPAIDRHPNKINEHAQAALNQLLTGPAPDQWQQAVYQAFGQLVTEPRHPGTDAPSSQWTAERVKGLLEQRSSISLRHDPQSRIAFSGTRLFVNGVSYAIDETFSRAVCDQSLQGPLSDQHMAVLLDLLKDGCVTIAV